MYWWLTSTVSITSEWPTNSVKSKCLFFHFFFSSDCCSWRDNSFLTFLAGILGLLSSGLRQKTALRNQPTDSGTHSIQFATDLEYVCGVSATREAKLEALALSCSGTFVSSVSASWITGSLENPSTSESFGKEIGSSLFSSSCESEAKHSSSGSVVVVCTATFWNWKMMVQLARQQVDRS